MKQDSDSAFQSVWEANTAKSAHSSTMALVMSDINISQTERDIIQKYDINMEGCDDWDLSQWENFEDNKWHLYDELKERFEEIFPPNYEREDKEEKGEMERLEEEEKEAREEYFKQLEEMEANNPKTGDQEAGPIYYSDEEESEEEEEPPDPEEK